MNNVSCKEITASAVFGDQQDFRVFYDLYYLKVYRFVHYFLPDQHDCEAVVSDVFCIVWEKRRLLANVENMEAYLYQICRNESLHHIKRKRRLGIVSIDEKPMEVSPVAGSIEDAMTEREMMQVYRLAVDTLPERCKSVFQMVREQKLSHKQVSEIMGITPGTIEIQMNIAIKKVANIIKTRYPILMKQC